MTPIEKRQLQDLYQSSKALTQVLRSLLRAHGLDDARGAATGAGGIARAARRVAGADLRYRAAWLAAREPLCAERTGDDPQAAQDREARTEQGRRDAPADGPHDGAAGAQADDADGNPTSPRDQLTDAARHHPQDAQ